MQDTQSDGSAISDPELSDAVTQLAPLENAYSESASTYEAQTQTQNSDTDPDGNTDTMLPSQHIAQMNWDVSAVDAAADALSKAAAALENAINTIADARKTAMAQWKGDAAEAADKDFGTISSYCSDQLKQIKGLDTAMTGDNGVVPALKSMSSRIDSEAATLAKENADNVQAIYDSGNGSSQPDDGTIAAAPAAVYQAISTMKNFIWTQLDGLSGVTKAVQQYEQPTVTLS